MRGDERTIVCPFCMEMGSGVATGVLDLSVPMFRCEHCNSWLRGNALVRGFEDVERDNVREAHRINALLVHIRRAMVSEIGRSS